MRLVIQETHAACCSYVAAYVCQRITEFAPTADRLFVLGLPTSGASAALTLQTLVEYTRQGKLSFEHVAVFGTDEFVGLPRDHPMSGHSFLWYNLFKDINIKPEHVHLLDGNAPDVYHACKDFERQIEAYGGVELFLAGVSEDGRIAQNEPGSSLVSRTRVKTLAQQTIDAHAKHFDNDVSRVPKLVLTVGVGTFLDAREVVLVFAGACGQGRRVGHPGAAQGADGPATGANGMGGVRPRPPGASRAQALAKCVEEGVCHMWTASAIQMHGRATVVCDEDATLEMRVKTVRYFKSIQEVHGQVMQQA